MYCTRSVCEKEEKPFLSKIDMAVQCVAEFEPVGPTLTHVLADSWFLCQELWRGCKKRDFAISGGLKCNRKPRCKDEHGRTVYRSLAEYAVSLTPEQFTECVRPSASGGNRMFVHRVRTIVRKLGACQVLVVRHKADASVKQTRYSVTSLLDADTETILNILAIRWKIETFFDDLKELFGSDHYQVMSATSILRFWTLACCGYVFLEEQRAQRGEASSSIGTIRRMLYKEHQCRLLAWLENVRQNGNLPHELTQRLAT